MLNEGQVCLNLQPGTGSDAQQLVQSVFQVADLIRPLMSLSQICEQGHKCVFEKDHTLVITPEGGDASHFGKAFRALPGEDAP